MFDSLRHILRVYCDYRHATEKRRKLDRISDTVSVHRNHGSYRILDQLMTFSF